MNKILILLFSWAFFSVQGLMAQSQNPEYAKVFPAFEFVKPNNTPFTHRDLKPNTPTIVFFFDPDCDHCQKQAQWINENPAPFKNAQLLWVSTAELTAINIFHKTSFAKYPHPIFFAKDHKYKFDSIFGYSVAPTILIYNAKGQFVKAFKKETPVQELAQYLK